MILSTFAEHCKTSDTLTRLAARCPYFGLKETAPAKRKTSLYLPKATYYYDHI